MALALQILASGFAAGAVYGLVGVGHSVVFRLTGVVHFAFGELIALGVFTTLLVAAGTGPVSQTSVGGGRFLVALLVGLVVTGAASAGSYFLAIEPYRARGSTIGWVAASLAVAFAVRTLLVVFFDKPAYVFPDPLPFGVWRIGGATIQQRALFVGSDGAIAIVDEGTGVDASWRIAARRGVPICIVFAGGQSLVNAATRPNVFRIAPTDHGIAFRLAEYLVPKHLKVAVLHDDSDYGAAGAKELKRAFADDPASVAIDETLPADALDVSPQILRARRAHATALLVWGRPATIASAITAARSAGWNVPFYTPPTGADPFVRQQLADHPTWVDGLTFAAGRLTAEVGAAPFTGFAQRYVAAYGVDRVGVRTSTGAAVTEPPETAMYAYDFVNVLAAALTKAGSTDPAKVSKALEDVTVEGANGDERAFNHSNHDGVVDDDVYFARFHDMTYSPVKDDPLSATLPTIPQTQ